MTADRAAPDLAAGVAALIGRALGDDELFGVAVSGGPDSLALLFLAHRAFSDRVRAVTVDHGLRPEAAAEAALGAGYAALLGVPHHTLRWDGPHPTTNLQAAARAARYRLMGEWCAEHAIGWLATAHHRDDQAETLLLRLARGSGSGGLAGIRARRRLVPGVELLRPLLGSTKPELAAVVAAAGWRAVDDPSNRAARFDRTGARAALAATPWLDPARLAASAAHLAEVEAALVWTTDVAWRGRVVASAGSIAIDAAGLPRELTRRIVLRAIMALAPDRAPRGEAMDRLLDGLAKGSSATLSGVAVRVASGLWHLKAAAPRR